MKKGKTEVLSHLFRYPIVREEHGKDVCWYFIRDNEKVPITFGFVDLIEDSFQLGCQKGNEKQGGGTN